MVEQWSSKSYAWVRFLLSLLYKNKSFKYSKGIDNRKIVLTNFIKKHKYFYKNKKINGFFNKFNNNNYFFFQMKKVNQNNNPILNNKINNYNHLFNKLFFYSLSNNFAKNLFSLNFNQNLFVFYKFLSNKTIMLFFINFLKITNFTFFNNFIQKNDIYVYYQYYLNHFLFFNNKSIFFKNNIINKISDKNFKFFNNYRFISNSKTQSFFKINKINKLNIFKNWLNFTSKWNLSNIKIKTTFNIILNKSFSKYFFYSKLYFKNFNYLINNSLNKQFNIFKLSKHDYVSNYLVRLTRDSIRLNVNDFFTIKNSLFLNNSSFKLIFLFNNYNNDNILLENNYFISSFFNKITSNFNKYDFYSKISNLFNKNKNNIEKNKVLVHHIFFNYLNNYNFSNTYNKFNSFFKFNKFEILIFFFFKPLFFKYIMFKNNSLNKLPHSIFFNKIINYTNEYFFYSKHSYSHSNNLIPNESFSFILKKKMIKIFNYSKFPTITTIWHYNSLIRFLEFCSGKKVYIKLNTFLNNNLNFNEKSQCLLWSQKVKYFRKVLGPRLFLNESLQIIYLSLKLKDPYIFSNWIISTIQKISFWKYKTFLRYIKYVLRYFFWIIFKQLNIKGVKFQLKGKISVAGNARTRTVLHSIGFTSHSTFNNKILYNLNLIKTFTGVLGLKLWIVF